jgi:hypothetical protein
MERAHNLAMESLCLAADLVLSGNAELRQIVGLSLTVCRSARPSRSDDFPDAAA